MKTLASLLLACLCTTLAQAQQPVTVLNNGAGGGTLNTPGVTTYFGGANTFNFVGSTVIGIPTNVGSQFATLSVTGISQLNGAVGIAGTSPSAIVDLADTSTTTNNAERIGAEFTPTSSQTSGAFSSVVAGGLFIALVGAANTQNWTGSPGLDGGILEAVTQTGATGTITEARAGDVAFANGGSTTITKGSLLYVRAAINSGTITSLAGINAASQTVATNNTDILYGTTTIPTGANYGIYQGDSYANYFNGATSFGITVKAPGFQTVGAGSPSTGSITGSSIEGLELFGGYSSGAGATNDIALYNSSTVLVAAVPAGTTQFNVVGSISASNMPYSGGSATSGAYTATLPVIIAIKSVTILTAGTPANLATIVLPAGLTRYLIATSTSSITCYAETAAGTLAGGTIQLRTATGGGGSQMGSTITPPAALNGVTGTGGSDTAPWTNGTIYLYQTGNSANAGTVSIYITIKPII